MPADWAEEIDIFEGQLHLRKQGKIDEKVFAETRLRRGSYGQRYDNGQRHDGVQPRRLPYDEKPTKGAETVWDAPGRSEEHTSELQSRQYLVCRLLLEKKK